MDGVGTLRILDAIRTCGMEKEVKFYQVRGKFYHHPEYTCMYIFMCTHVHTHTHTYTNTHSAMHTLVLFIVYNFYSNKIFIYKEITGYVMAKHDNRGSCIFVIQGSSHVIQC